MVIVNKCDGKGREVEEEEKEEGMNKALGQVPNVFKQAGL